MNARTRTQLLLLGVLLSSIAVLLVRIASRASGAAVELDRAKAAEPSTALLERLSRLDSELELVWYASPRAELPAEYRALEPVIERLFRAIERASPAEHGGPPAARVRARIVDPTRDATLAPHLAALGLAPFRARSIESDAWRERSVWSTLRIAYGPHGAATIAALGPEHLPLLQALIVAELDQLERPRAPRVAVAAPDEYGALRRAVRAEGEIQDSDFESSARLPEDADLFLWIEPEHASAAHLAELERFLARGRSVVVAGSRWRGAREGTRPEVRFEATRFPADVLLPHFGLVPHGAPLFEARANEALAAGGAPLATERVRSIGEEQDFRALVAQPNGTLSFATPTSFQPDPRRLADQDLVVSVLASSSASVFLRDVPEGVVASSALQPDAETRMLGPQPLLALLAPLDPWRGRIVFAASAAPFADQDFAHPGYAHGTLIAILLRSLASGERLALSQAAGARPEPLAELSAAERAGWRAAVVLGVPALLAAAAFFRLRGARSALSGRPREGEVRSRRGWLIVPAAAAAALAIVRLVPSGFALDLSRAGANSLAPQTETLFARRARELGGVELELLFSEDGELPPEFRPAVARARELARTIASRVGEVLVRVRTPAEDEALPRVRVTSEEDEVVAVRRVHSLIRVRARGTPEHPAATEDLALPDVASFERLEFRLAFALERLARGRPVKIALAADVPRLSPAEALSDFQKKGLFAPSEGDVYSEARALLAAQDFRLVFVDAEKPALPADADLFLWLQPRRDVRPLVAALARWLAEGGRAVVAAQHFVVRSRQRQAKDLSLSLWPEPQFPDLERTWFPALGLHFPRELVLDELAGTVDVETRVERGAASTQARERATSPLLVRAVAANFPLGAPIVGGLSDLLFAFGSHATWDGAELARHGLRARSLVESSPRAWTYDWKGGDLPADALSRPAGTSDRRLALAALVEGRFPGPEIDPALEAGGSAPRSASGREGRLVWIGSSEMFKNGRLHLPGYDHAAFLLASVAELALEPELAAILARRNVEPGFELVTPSARISWRALVIGGAPLSLLLFGIAHAARRRSAPVAIEVGSSAPRAGIRGA